MNKKEQLLAETLGDGEGESFAGIAAAHARRRRAVKRYSLPVAAAVATLAIFFVTDQPPFESQPVARASAPAVEIISDEELLAQLRGDAVLILKGGKGITGVVFLTDDSSTRRNAR
jgi:hypothetical protein